MKTYEDVFAIIQTVEDILVLESTVLEGIRELEVSGLQEQQEKIVTGLEQTLSAYELLRHPYRSTIS